MVINFDVKFNSLKIPPYSIEAEQSVLGGLLFDNSIWDCISDFINEDSFYRYDHKIIFQHILKLINLTKPADTITVYESILNYDKHSNIGGLNYLSFLVQNTPSIANIKRYAEIVRDKSILRKLINVFDEISKKIFSPKGKNVKQILDETESKIFSISKEGQPTKKVFTQIQPLIMKIVENSKELYLKGGCDNITGISTGFVDLDKITSGLQSGDLIIIASRPSMGKTAFSINIGENIAINTGLPVIVFSMEMGSIQLATRILGSICQLDQNKLRTGKLSKKDWININYSIKKIRNIKFFIDESPSLTSNEIRSKSRRMYRKYGKLGLIIVDYLQLMSGNNKSENRTLEISEISRNLKNLAKELNCPLIALSQLNRSLEQRTNKRPIMSDLRDSGAIEQDADLILFIYREELYNPNSINKGIAEIIIGKQRNGPIGNIKLTFLGKYTKYKNYVNTNYSSFFKKK